VWRDVDGTEAVAFGRRLFAAVPGGPIHHLPASVLAEHHGGLLNLRRIVRRLLGLCERPEPPARRPSRDLDELATPEEVAAVLKLVRHTLGPDDLASARATRWEACFAAVPPAVSTLRAVLSDFRLHHGPLDPAADAELLRLRAELADGTLRGRRARADCTSDAATLGDDGTPQETP